MNARRSADPFAVLGLERRAGLTDDDVRLAWRRLAAATHPDRADGGDPEAFAAAAAAYTLLRTATGRGEALADLDARRAEPAGLSRSRPGPFLGVLARAWRGRVLRLALRSGVAAVISAATVLIAGWQPATPALITGALTWLALTARRDLAPPG